MPPAIQIRELGKTYPKKIALEGLSLTIEQGQVFGFLGENGAGKTTTIKLLLGLIQPSSGHIELFGCPLKKHGHPLMARVGSLVEAPSFYGHLTARQNMRILALLRKLPESAIVKALETTGLGSAMDTKVRTFSHGMCQRLGIAMAILGEPELVILDEPTNGLDPSGIRDIRHLIKSLPEQFGTTVLVSSHLLVEVEQIATQIGILQRGKLIFEGSMTHLRHQMSNSIHIDTSQPLKAAETLRLQGFDCSSGDGFVKVVGPASAIDSLTQILVGERIPLHGIRAEASRLEDVYFKLTSREP